MERKTLDLVHPIVVEGKYDKIRLSSFVTSPVIILGGFSAFNNKEKLAELKTFGKNGLIILTDSDKAGVFIRGKLKGLLGDIKLINVYTPVIRGSDSRRNHVVKDGVLGVESVECGILYKLLLPFVRDNTKIPFLTKNGAYDDGICGKASSSILRKELCRAFGLPETISANMLIEYVNTFVDEADYRQTLQNICGDCVK